MVCLPCSASLSIDCIYGYTIFSILCHHGGLIVPTMTLQALTELPIHLVPIFHSFGGRNAQFPPSLAILLGRFRVQPENDKGQEANNHTPQSSNPWPCAADGPRSRPFVVGKVPHCHLDFFFNVGQPRSFVVDFECKDAMLVGSCKCGREGRAVGRG